MREADAYDGEKHRERIRLRREREKELRILRILEAAKRVFFSRGYLRATMDLIAAEAELSKPTLYQYFKNKDDLYLSLMLPTIARIGEEVEKVRARLTRGRYGDGSGLVRDLMKAFFKAYESDPEAFRIVQVFQQAGLVRKMKSEVNSALDAQGSHNFRIGREIIREGTRRGLLRKVDPFALVDVLWGLFVGIVQLEDIKSQGKETNPFLKKTLRLAERLLAQALDASGKSIP
ncbi:MAG: TetR/AcrR family transcriptional regulator [Deltaproteobacteria bacterium]|nr:TetR/AcrR family transcriptional regulator [Deltaproteobacteria bacterium]MBW1950777.1 TetR/AcrR family transcriptional regulator [Deltaproteobacteria bacterium]MBW2009089.1 TetR/AcrR family transcriptional regulator [Deltaproteobacteria bacterium]MBW2349107.1 TetR/AcrR family transcriptional regulator [Deltaproteobacteria bacterium]